MKLEAEIPDVTGQKLILPLDLSALWELATSGSF